MNENNKKEFCVVFFRNCRRSGNSLQERRMWTTHTRSPQKNPTTLQMRVIRTSWLLMWWRPLTSVFQTPNEALFNIESQSKLKTNLISHSLSFLLSISISLSCGWSNNCQMQNRFKGSRRWITRCVQVQIPHTVPSSRDEKRFLPLLYQSINQIKSNQINQINQIKSIN
jgi:hypothetical protein